jgi:hypothetical protein
MAGSLSTGSSGLIGLCPQHKTGEDVNNWSLWIDEMLKADIIQQRVYSFSVSDHKNVSSKAIWGGYDMEKYAAPGSELEWHDIDPKSVYW